MFIHITAEEDGLQAGQNINVMHIVRFCLANPRNVDSGTQIYMKDGTYWETSLTIDVVQSRIDRVVERFGNQILVSYLSEMMQEPKPKRKYTKRDQKVK